MKTRILQHHHYTTV